MWSVLDASQETLQTLDFLLSVKIEKVQPFLLWQMRFPRLKSLTLRGCDTLCEVAVEFVVITHSGTLEELNLDYRGDFTLAISASGKLEADSLPRLKSFRGHSSFFKKMVE